MVVGSQTSRDSHANSEFLPQPPEGPPPARVTKKHLVCSDGSTVRIRSPNLHRALTQTGVALEQLKAKPRQEFLKDGALPEVAERRFEAYEALRMHHWEMVLGVRQKVRPRPARVSACLLGVCSWG
eukprot:SAG22_NODE_962_length_6280_cov_4.343472_10_plen_126_part_00